MSDDNLAYHAENVLKSPAFIHVCEVRERDILNQLLAAKGWIKSETEAKRKELLDDLAAIRRVKADLEMLVRAKSAPRKQFVA